MTQTLNRRHLLLGLSAFAAPLGVPTANAQARAIWSASAAYDALRADSMRIIDVRTRDEWQETGVGAGVWPLSMHEDRFTERLFAAKALAGDRVIGLICATGGRSASLVRALQRAGYDGYADISEGMLGSRRGAGWIRTGLPVVSIDTALASLPVALA